MTINKDAIYARVLQLLDRDWDVDPETLDGGACLPFTVCGMIALYELTGIKPMLQAGSAHFRFIPRELDDGFSHTTFSYQWEPKHPLSVARIAKGQLPEIHCWLAIKETREIVDFSTAYIEHHAAQCGHRWIAPPLPKYLWSTKLPDGMLYLPDLAACHFVKRFIEEKVCRKLKQNYQPISKP